MLILVFFVSSTILAIDKRVAGVIAGQLVTVCELEIISREFFYPVKYGDMSLKQAELKSKKYLVENYVIRVLAAREDLVGEVSFTALVDAFRNRQELINGGEAIIYGPLTMDFGDFYLNAHKQLRVKLKRKYRHHDSLSGQWDISNLVAADVEELSSTVQFKNVFPAVLYPEYWLPLYKLIFSETVYPDDYDGC
ncbi:hypothetical protein NF212_22135 [Parasalinivibrio latis]|uniref:hypothetical protein n=1 Tax=Parasalinivibrio latis TaxID=2952610 RepID=UPI0030E0E52C